MMCAAGRPRATGAVAPRSGSAVIYARFSCSKQREASIEDQLRVCREWCADNGYEVVAEYADHAMSGRSDDRPEFQRMVANAGESEIVLVYMMDRFSRDVYDAPIYKKRLKERGVRVVSATETMPDGPEAILIESIYEAMAAMESAHISRRVTRGMEGNARKCMHNGSRLYGYDLGDDGFYHINEGQAQNVRDAFSLRASGWSLGKIAEELRSRGVISPRGKPCSYNMVGSMIRNEKYAGTYSWGDVRVEGGMPAIVTMEEFEMANGIRSAKRRRDEEWTDFLLSGKAMCGECGMNLVGVSGRGKRNVKYSYYRCSKRCGCKTVRADWLEGQIVDRLRMMLTDPDVVSSITGMVEEGLAGRDETVRLETARKSLEEAERAIANITRAIESGMPYDDVRARYEELRSQRDRMSREVDRLSEAVAFDPEEFAESLSVAKCLDDAHLIDAFVWQVQLTTDMVTVVLNFDEGKDEPARMVFPTGSNELAWWAVRGSNPGPWD